MGQNIYSQGIWKTREKSSIILGPQSSLHLIFEGFVRFFSSWWLSSQPILKHMRTVKLGSSSPIFGVKRTKSLKPPPSFGLKLKTPNKKSSKPLGAGPCFGRICKLPKILQPFRFREDRIF